MADTTKPDTKPTTGKKDLPRLILTVPRQLIPGGKQHAAGSTLAEIRILADVNVAAVDKAIQARAVRVVI